MFPHPPLRPNTQTPDDKPPPSPPPTGRDRGPAAFFHGRESIRSRFDTVLSESTALNAGTTFLIQGAPGAGKTALLDVLSHQAEPKGWTVVKIGLQDLYTPASMAQSLGTTYTIDKEYALQVGVQFLGGGLVGRISGHVSPREILRHLAPETGLILVLDEVQRMNKIPDESERHTIAGDTLEMIHNGTLGKPVMLLTAGLSTSETALSSLGVSRFDRKCTVKLGGLDKESESAVIRDWLTQAGGVVEDPTPWIESISEQTHGWPQHIISYVKPAEEYLNSNNHRMTDKGLESVLKQGAEARKDYYTKRVRGIDRKKRVSLARIFANVPLGETMKREDIISALTKEYSEEESGKLFKDALERGIVDERDDGDYGVPIPSFHTWLIDNYGKDRD